MRLKDHTHAWSGRLSALINTSKADILDRLIKFLPDASDSQHRAWDREVDILQSEAVTVVRLHPVAGDDGTVLEYILPRQGGRRPDVVLLQNGRVVVVEFKETGQLRRSDIDQVAAYARDLQLYHSACQEQQVTPILVLCGRGAVEREVDGVQIVPANRLGRCLVTLGKASTGTRLDLSEFLEGSYEPLPSLVAAREYVRRRFAGETQRRYGLLASSRAKNLDSYGIDPGFLATRRVRIARWFNDGLESAEGGCHLDTVITQFQCQGLELDLPIICWGDDFWWSDREWRSKEGRRQRLVRDPHQLRLNAYRVLLTRGREGVVIFVPTSPAEEMDATVRALESAGALYVRSERGVAAA